MLGGPNQRQHVVEFKDGTGVTQDGIVVNSASGPWTWTVPEGVRMLMLNGVGGGAGGTGGTNNATSTGGGGGGGSALSIMDLPVFVTPGSSLTITLGAAGTGGTPTTGATNGGDTTIAGIYFSPWGEGTTFRIFGGGANTTTRTDGVGQASGIGAGNAPGSYASTASAGGTSAATPTAAPGTGRVYFFPSTFPGMTGSGGGGASTTGTTSGANGGVVGLNPNTFALITAQTSTTPNAGVGLGNTAAGVSRGGGGQGGYSVIGYPGAGGAGGSNGGNATGYGAGGGGGGGAANGGNGSVGYVYFTYWDVD